jgi:hypothetical protein
VPQTLRAKRIAATKAVLEKPDIPLAAKVRRLMELTATVGLGIQLLVYAEKKLQEFRSATRNNDLHLLMLKIDEQLELRKMQERERRTPHVAGRKKGRPRKQAEAVKQSVPTPTAPTMPQGLVDLLATTKAPTPMPSKPAPAPANIFDDLMGEG